MLMLSGLDFVVRLFNGNWKDQIQQAYDDEYTKLRFCYASIKVFKYDTQEMIFSCGKIMYSAYNSADYISNSVFFSLQLYSLNDYKPPISKAKMTQITKAAIKAIKVWNQLSSFDLFYISHVCQNNFVK